MIKIKNNEFVEKELVEAEKMELRTNFKFGIVCCKPDETTEDGLFAVSKNKTRYFNLFYYINVLFLDFCL